MPIEPDDCQKSGEALYCGCSGVVGSIPAIPGQLANSPARPASSGVTGFSQLDRRLDQKYIPRNLQRF